METVRLARMAMASRFELIVRGDRDPAWLRAAGEEALAEVTRLDAQLSFYSPASDISRINRTAHAGEVPVEPRLFRLLILGPGHSCGDRRCLRHYSRSADAVLGIHGA